ncbi:MAG TPA: serine/threonine-protein kinase [Candidatus Nanoarchaeia archaeon]|nr:serine/threonine-protein kinase [Candidatus Nanoarchaeia archaeon]
MPSPTYDYETFEDSNGSARRITYISGQDAMGHDLLDRTTLFFPVHDVQTRPGTLFVVREQLDLSHRSIEARLMFPHSSGEKPHQPHHDVTTLLSKVADAFVLQTMRELANPSDRHAVPDFLRSEIQDGTYHKMIDLFYKAQTSLVDEDHREGYGRRAICFPPSGNQEDVDYLSYYFIKVAGLSHQPKPTVSLDKSDFTLIFQGHPRHAQKQMDPAVQAVLLKRLAMDKYPAHPDQKLSQFDEGNPAHISLRARIMVDLQNNKMREGGWWYRRTDGSVMIPGTRSFKDLLGEASATAEKNVRDDWTRIVEEDRKAHGLARQRYATLAEALRTTDFVVELLDTLGVVAVSAGLNLTQQQDEILKTKDPLRREELKANYAFYSEDLLKQHQSLIALVNYVQQRNATSLHYRARMHHRFDHRGVRDNSELDSAHVLGLVLNKTKLGFPSAVNAQSPAQREVQSSKEALEVTLDLGNTTIEVPSQDRSPMVAGRYRLEEVIGAGGMSIAYRATDLEAGERSSRRTVAIKVARNNPEKLRLTAKNSAALLGYNHEHAAQMLDLAHRDGVQEPYIVLEYIQGATLEEITSAKGPLEPSIALEIVKQTARGLLGTRDLCAHLDVKGANIVMTQDGRAKLIDFGLKGSMEASDLEHSFLTQDDIRVAGTVGYMAPEVRETGGDHRSDLFSLGQVLYKVVVGHLPETSELPSQLNPAVPKQVDEIYQALTRRNPLQRMTAEALIKSIDGLQADSTVKDIRPCKITVVPPMRVQEQTVTAESSNPSTAVLEIQQPYTMFVQEQAEPVTPIAPQVIESEEIPPQAPVLITTQPAPESRANGQTKLIRPDLDEVLRSKADVTAGKVVIEE